MDKTQIYQQKEYAEGYDEDRYGGEFGQYLHDLELNTYLSLMDSSYKNILDLGAGTGKLCIPLSSKYESVVAVDFSSEMIKVARRKAEERNTKLNVIVCDAQRLCFKDKTFDCVVSSRMLMHLDDLRKGISELCRVSKRVVIFDFPPLFSFGCLDSFLKMIWKDSQTYKAFSLGDVKRELGESNFAIVDSRRHFFLPIAFHRWLQSARLSERIENLFGGVGLIALFGAPVTIKAIRVNRSD
jgi:ubiquinone/menaquinone biosynthesis C-methylase UbiE